MKNAKKLIALLLAAVMLFSLILTACGGDTEPTETEPSTTQPT